MTKKKSARQVREEKLKALIELVRDRYSDEEIVEAFSEVTRIEYTEKQEEPTEGDMVADLTIKGYCIFKPQSITQAEELRRYAEKYVFPYINDQISAILY